MFPFFEENIIVRLFMLPNYSSAEYPLTSLMTLYVSHTLVLPESRSQAISAKADGTNELRSIEKGTYTAQGYRMEAQGVEFV